MQIRHQCKQKSCVKYFLHLVLLDRGSHGDDDDNVQDDGGDDHLVLLDLVDHRDVVLSTLHFPTAEMIDNW